MDWGCPKLGSPEVFNHGWFIGPLAKVDPKECAMHFFPFVNAIQEIILIFCAAFPSQA
jgi:hypothetical protein